jgi:hypothetical protein
MTLGTRRARRGIVMVQVVGMLITHGGRGGIPAEKSEECGHGKPPQQQSRTEENRKGYSTIRATKPARAVRAAREDKGPKVTNCAGIRPEKSDPQADGGERVKRVLENQTTTAA